VKWLRGTSPMAAKLRVALGDANDDDKGNLQIDPSDPIGSAKQRLHRRAMLDGGADWHRLFSFYDRDGRGVLSFSEFKTMMRKDAGMGPAVMPAEMMQTLFDDIDSLGTATSGVIDIDEFVLWLDGGDEEEESKSLAAQYMEPVPNDPFDFDEDGVSMVNLFQEDEDRSAVRVDGVYDVVESVPFTALFALAILANTVILAADHHNIDPALEKLLHSCNVVLTLLFVVELGCKLVAYTNAAFWSDYFNIFDFVIVFFGLLELSEMVGFSLTAFRTFRVFRLFRVLRVVRVISFLNPLKMVFAVIMRTLGDLVSILVLLFLFIFIFCIIGMQMCGAQLECRPQKLSLGPKNYFSTQHLCTEISWAADNISGRLGRAHRFGGLLGVPETLEDGRVYVARHNFK
jgi:hypothetical protein